MDEAVQKFIALINREHLPADHETISRDVLQRKHFMPIYVAMVWLFRMADYPELIVRLSLLHDAMRAYPSKAQ